MKHQYLKDLRQDSCYPAIRGAVSFLVGIGYVGCMIVVLAGIFIAFQGRGGYDWDQFWAGAFLLLCAVFFFIVIKVGQECVLMLADIADCVIDSRVSQDDRLI